MMKRSISCILSVVLLTTVIHPFNTVNALAENAEYSFESYENENMYDKAVKYMKVMQLFPEAEETENITKGQAVNCIIKSVGLEKVAASYSDEYTYDEKMAAVAHDIGILSGTTPQEWELDSEINLEQCAKMLVVALGYGSFVTDSNPYPDWYLSRASTLQITKYGVSGQNGKVTVRDFMLMLYQAMKCDIVEISSLSNNRPSYDISNGYLLENHYLDSMSWIKSEGIVQADYYSSTIGKENCDYSKIMIDEKYYTCDSDACKGMTGFSVEFVYTDPDKTEEMKIVGMYPGKNNTVYGFHRNKDMEYKNGVLTYYNENNRKKDIELSDDVVYVYNNRLYTPYTLSDIDFNDTTLRLVDNNGDEEYDVVFITESESMVINDVRDEKIYIKTGELYSKKMIDLSDTDEMTLCMHDLDGNVITLEDIKANCAISVIASLDLSYMEIILLGEEFEGKVNGYSSEDETITIDGNVYGAKIDVNVVNIGNTYKFRVNENNDIFYVDSVISDCTYIVKKYWDEEQELAIIRIYDNINGIQSLELADKANVDGTSYKNQKDAYDAIRIKTLANITGDNDGMVKKIEYLEPYGESALRQYRIHAQGFNDVNEAESTPFRFDESTTFFYVPESGDANDFGINVPLKNEDDYVTQGFEYNEDTGCVRAVVVTVDTDKRADNYLTHNSDVGIVKSIRACITPDDQTGYEIVGYHEGEEFTYYSEQYDDVFNVCDTLKKGDVIRYISNYNNEIVRISKIVSLSEVDESFIDGRDSVDEQMYGQVITLNKNVLTNFEKYLCHEMTVSATEGYNDLVPMRLFADIDNPYDSNCEFADYYCYNKKTKEVTPASIEDIISYEDAGDGATKVFVQRSKSEVQFVVIVEE